MLDRIFHPNQRTLFVGKIDANWTAADLWRHYIPGWYGITGAIIGILVSRGTAVHNGLEGIDVALLGLCILAKPHDRCPSANKKLVKGAEKTGFQTLPSMHDHQPAVG